MYSVPFKKTALAVSLALAASLAQAETIFTSPDLDPLPNGENYTFENTSVTTPSFNDWLSFTVTGNRTLYASISGVSNFGVTFTAFDLYADGDLVNALALGTTGNFSPRITYGGLTAATGPATYWINIAGTGVPVTTYNGNIALTAAVPEPETYGMMLVGVGLIGMMARRRRNLS